MDTMKRKGLENCEHIFVVCMMCVSMCFDQTLCFGCLKGIESRNHLREYLGHFRGESIRCLAVFFRDC